MTGSPALLGFSGACFGILSWFSLFLLVDTNVSTSTLYFSCFCFLFPPLTFCCPVRHGLSDWNGDWDTPKIGGFIQSEKLAAQQPCKLLFYECLPSPYFDFCRTSASQFCIHLSLMLRLLFLLLVLIVTMVFKFTGCYRNAFCRGVMAATSRSQTVSLKSFQTVCVDQCVNL